MCATEERCFDYWSIDAFGDEQLKCYRSEFQRLLQDENKILTKLIVSVSSVVAFAFLFIENQEKIDQVIVERVWFLLAAGLFWFLFWAGIAIGSMNPDFLFKKTSILSKIAFEQSKGNAAASLNVEDWKETLRNAIVKQTRYLESLNSTYKKGIAGSAFMAIGAIYSLLMPLSL